MCVCVCVKNGFAFISLLYNDNLCTGLEKLASAASQVSTMQQELRDLQPQLIKTSEETVSLMVIIEQETVEVEAKREVGCMMVMLCGFR